MIFPQPPEQGDDDDVHSDDDDGDDDDDDDQAAVHQLVLSLAAPGSGLPEASCVAAILPVTLDTPMNRKFMPGADT